MLEMILNFFMDIASGIIYLLIGVFEHIITFDLANFLQVFPVANTFYEMFQAVGIGLVIVITFFQLMRFFGGPLTKTTEKPFTILVRAFFAIGLIFFGNYILNLAFSATGKMFDVFMGVKNQAGPDLGGQISTALGSASVAGAFADWGLYASGISGLFVLIAIVLCIVMIVQFIKMMLELVERYVTLCLLIFSSPLGWSTFTSESTMTIFKKWISMVIAQCMLMILSAWGAVMFLSCMGANANIIQRLFFGFALIKIIKRFDTYLQQIGLNAAGIGGSSLLDEVARTAGSLGRMTGGGGKTEGGKNSILGGGGFLGNMVSRSPITKGIMGAAEARGTGASFWQSIKQGGKAFAKGTVARTPYASAAVGKAAGAAARKVPHMPDNITGSQIINGTMERVASATEGKTFTDIRKDLSAEKKATAPLSASDAYASGKKQRTAAETEGLRPAMAQFRASVKSPSATPKETARNAAITANEAVKIRANGDNTAETMSEVASAETAVGAYVSESNANAQNFLNTSAEMFNHSGGMDYEGEVGSSLARTLSNEYAKDASTFGETRVHVGEADTSNNTRSVTISAVDKNSGETRIFQSTVSSKIVDSRSGDGNKNMGNHGNTSGKKRQSRTK